MLPHLSAADRTSRAGLLPEATELAPDGSTAAVARKMLLENLGPRWERDVRLTHYRHQQVGAQALNLEAGASPNQAGSCHLPVAVVRAERQEACPRSTGRLGFAGPQRVDEKLPMSAWIGQSFVTTWQENWHLSCCGISSTWAGCGRHRATARSM